MLLVQNALKNKEHTLDSLKQQLGINATRHGQQDNLVLLKYDQIESPMDNPIVQECRGLILDEANNWEIVSHPYHKFFNWGEPNAAAVDWNTAKIQEKADGSLIVMYRYNYKWECATSGMPDAGGNINGSATTFRELFATTFHEQGMKYPLESDSDYTFMFELMSPQNRIVVKHAVPEIIFLGARNNITGQEVSPTFFAGQERNWRLVKEYPF